MKFGKQAFLWPLVATATVEPDNMLDARGLIAALAASKSDTFRAALDRVDTRSPGLAPGERLALAWYRAWCERPIAEHVPIEALALAGLAFRMHGAEVPS